MRIRSIKPEFWKDELVSKWPVQTRLTYIGLWSEADDWGRVRWVPDYLRAAIFPYDTRMNMAAALKPIEDSRRVFVYEVQGNRYAVILSWPKHQNINRKSRPQLPDPPRDALASFIEDSLKAQCGLTECSVSVHDYFTDDSVSAQRPSRVRASQGAGSREQGAGSREQECELGVDADGFFHGLVDSGKFPGLQASGVAMVIHQHHPDSTEKDWAAVLEEARSMPGVIASPVQWLSRALGRVVELRNSAKTGAAPDAGYAERRARSFTGIERDADA